MTRRHVFPEHGDPSHRIEVSDQPFSLSEREAWIEQRVSHLVVHEDYTAAAARTRATGEWQHHLAGLAAHEGARRAWEPRVFGRRLPLAVERLLPEIVTEREPPTKSNRTTVSFPWDSRSYIVRRGDAGWFNFIFLGNRAREVTIERVPGTRRVRVEVTW